MNGKCSYCVNPTRQHPSVKNHSQCERLASLATDWAEHQTQDALHGIAMQIVARLSNPHHPDHTKAMRFLKISIAGGENLAGSRYEIGDAAGMCGIDVTDIDAYQDWANDTGVHHA